MERTSHHSRPRKSNARKKEEATERMRLLIAECDATGQTLPVKNGALWHAEIKRRASLSNGQFDGNRDIKAMLEAYAERHGIKYSVKGSVAPEEETLGEPVNPAMMVPIERLREVQQRFAAAQRKNAELMTENASLRAQMLRGNEVAELIALGGRISPGGFDQ